MPLVGWVWTINLTSRAIDNVYSDDSIAGCHFQAEPGQAVAHYLDIHLVADFSSKAGPFVPGCTRTVIAPGGTPPAVVQNCPSGETFSDRKLMVWRPDPRARSGQSVRWERPARSASPRVDSPEHHKSCTAAPVPDGPVGLRPRMPSPPGEWLCIAAAPPPKAASGRFRSPLAKGAWLVQLFSFGQNSSSSNPACRAAPRRWQAGNCLAG